ncbi:hypothetical protein [Caldisphaera sp.]|nr:hypothetical protein [Caldisphaera sp.]
MPNYFKNDAKMKSSLFQLIIGIGIHTLSSSSPETRPYGQSSLLE